jgi:hypothetical protein
MATASIIVSRGIDDGNIRYVGFADDRGAQT